MTLLYYYSMIATIIWKQNKHPAITGFERVTGEEKAALPPAAADSLLTSNVMGSDSDKW